MSSDHKVKGLLKGLRFISQIFDNNNEKEPQIQIGNPTDVRHVAHIGWDGHGPSENSPSWMNEFKSVPGLSSAPPNINGDNQCKGPDNSIKGVSSDSRGSRPVNCHGQEDIPELPKSSQRQSNSTGNMRECHAKEKSDRPRQQKRSSKHSQSNDSFNGSKHTEQPMHMDTDSLQLQVSDLPPKRSHSKKTKDASSSSVGGSSKSRSKAQHRDPNSNEGSTSKSRNKHRSHEENGQLERGSSEDMLRNYSN